MNNSIFPCLWFNGNAAQAANFYCTIFNAGKIIDHTPMVVTWQLNGKKFMGLNGGPMFTINPSISFFVKCNSLTEIQTIWDALIQGGKVLMPLNTYPWSEKYGWLQDQFGVTWQLMFDVAAHQTITPSFLFTNAQLGKAQQAITLYKSIFSNSSIKVLEQYPQDGPHAGQLMYGSFSLNNDEMIAMDGPGAHEYTFNEGVSLVVNCDTQEEIDYYWNNLITDGGQASQCGWLKDKFGVHWQIVPSILASLMSNADKAPRVMQAFMKMQKFDIATLLNA